jgi:hypothetical protein
MKNFTSKSKNSGIAWNLKLSVRIHGPYKKPVITGDWLQFSRKKGLAVGATESFRAGRSMGTMETLDSNLKSLECVCVYTH